MCVWIWQEERLSEEAFTNKLEKTLHLPSQPNLVNFLKVSAGIVKPITKNKHQYAECWVEFGQSFFQRMEYDLTPLEFEIPSLSHYVSDNWTFSRLKNEIQISMNLNRRNLYSIFWKMIDQNIPRVAQQ